MFIEHDTTEITTTLAEAKELSAITDEQLNEYQSLVCKAYDLAVNNPLLRQRLLAMGIHVPAPVIKWYRTPDMD